MADTNFEDENEDELLDDENYLDDFYDDLDDEDDYDWEE